MLELLDFIGVKMFGKKIFWSQQGNETKAMFWRVVADRQYGSGTTVGLGEGYLRTDIDDHEEAANRLIQLNYESN